MELGLNPMPELPSDEVAFQQELLAEMNTALDTILERRNRHFGAPWEGHKDSGQNLISLSSGALVLSMTAVQFVGSSGRHIEWRWLLFLAWSAFMITIVCGIIRFNWTGRAQAAPLLAENARAEILAEVKLLKSNPLLLQQIDEIVVRRLKEAVKPSDQAIEVLDNLTLVMLLLFTVGLLLLGVFAALNLP